ncbi:unnamed protein product, partial [marine sediment metagenome]
MDACIIMGRKCRAYDINPPKERKDIERWDIRDGFPEGVKGCDLIFLDPPYYDMVYGIHKSVDSFYDFIENLARNSF